MSVLTEDACRFLAELGSRFAPRVHELLATRAERQKKINAGFMPDFLPETRHIREGKWKIAGIPSDIQDRRVEITGPVDRKMVINALNSGAKVFMADFEDSHTPTWLDNMMDAVRRTISYTSPEGKVYKLNPQHAVLMVRPRGWHLFEKQFHVGGQPLPGGLFDFGLYFFHNAKEFLKNHGGVYFYLPKMESHLEARLWNDVFVFAQDYIGVPQGSVKATVLIETILASFEMDEILYELKDHIIGLNCGRWDYIFSFIKKFSTFPERVLPDRAQVTMKAHFMDAYSRLLIETCHKRGAFAMGGMAAQIPIKNDPAANDAAMAKVREDKLREVKNGHDGTWVAHPGLVPVAMEIFNAHMPGANQIERIPVSNVTAADLLKLPEGTITEQGLRSNISVGIQYIEAWLRGNGCVPIHNLMEDAATAEISRAQTWQWIKHPKGVLTDGRKISPEVFRQTVDEELAKIKAEIGENQYAGGKYKEATELFVSGSLAPQFEEFLTLSAYRMIDT
ncbi:hypothetical protein CHS0354_018374 [Potamilus streckersoni]|uniref:Malate synthase n=1 Tax=Potamilus streckersoni TaxID=2493646 RepID=A0AAE0WAY6_9BIVA|nr:hypothetical protein CHS0354_018374 [Potamilus streckersoni]